MQITALATEPREREMFVVAGMSCRRIVRGEETGGAWSMVEFTAEPAKGTPYHVAQRQDRVLYVVESAFRVRIAGRNVTLGPGGSVRIPRGVPHSFTCVGYEAGRVLVTCTPAGEERMLEELSRMAWPPDSPEMAELLAQHGLEPAA